MKSIQEKRLLLCLPEWNGRNHSLFLGICDLKAFLQEHGITVEVFDEDVASFAAEREKKSKIGILKDALFDFEPDYVGIHVNTPNYESAIRLAKDIRALSPHSIVIAGGPHASVAWREMLLHHKEFDFISVGEGELSILSLVDNISSCLNGIFPPGIAGRYHGELYYKPVSFIPCEKLVASERSALLESPFSDIKKWAKERYKDNFYNSIFSFDGRLATNAYVARGCTRKCSYCSPGAFWKDPLTGRPYQRIKTFSVIEKELRYLKDNGYGALYFDEMALPFQSADWIRRFAKLMKSYGFFWGGAVLFDQVRKVCFDQLADSGLRYIYFGYETPQQNLQKEIRKESSETDVLALMNRCFSCGIQCDLSMFFGIPGETDLSVKNTVSWLLDHLPRGNAFFSIAAIWPGTAWAGDYGLTPECWEPEYNKDNNPGGANWFSHDMTSVGKFYSNALGTYHPPYLTEEKALWIKDLIMESGFRKRFAQYSRSVLQK